MNKSIRAIVFGRVQGVYFRYYTRLEARRLHLTGWVANRVDGTVEVVAEGSENALEQFITFLHQGSPEAEVDGVQVIWQDATTEFSEFGVRRL